MQSSIKKSLPRADRPLSRRPTMAALAAFALCAALQGCVGFEGDRTYRIVAIATPDQAGMPGPGNSQPALVPQPAPAPGPGMPPPLSQPVPGPCPGGCPLAPPAQGPPHELPPPGEIKQLQPGLETTPLALLRQQQPGGYRLASGDVLGVWIEGVLGERGQSPPVRVEAGGRSSTLGYPIPVRSDGTISLPLVSPIRVAGLALEEAEEAIRRAYTIDKQILRPGRERLLVTLQRAREYRVLVVRQDSPTGGEVGEASGVLRLNGANQRGTAHTINLPAYENDVLHALARSGGLPGADAGNDVVIERAPADGGKALDRLCEAIQNTPPGTDPLSLLAGTQKVRVPLRYPTGQRPQVSPSDVVLQNGDVLIVEAR